MKVICKVLKPFTEQGAYYPVDSEIVLDKKRAEQMGDLVKVMREVEEEIKVIKKINLSARGHDPLLQKRKKC